MINISITRFDPFVKTEDDRRDKISVVKMNYARLLKLGEKLKKKKKKTCLL